MLTNLLLIMSTDLCPYVPKLTSFVRYALSVSTSSLKIPSSIVSIVFARIFSRFSFFEKSTDASARYPVDSRILEYREATGLERVDISDCAM